MRALVWFRNDLRVADNRALYEACRRAEGPVVAVFVPTPRQWREHDWGPPKVDFVLRNAAVLSAELERLGIPLLIRQTPSFGGLPRLLLKLVRELRCDAVFFNHEYEHNERVRDEAVTATLNTVFPTVHAIDVPGALNTILVATAQPTTAGNLRGHLAGLDAQADPLLREALATAVTHLVPATAGEVVVTDERAPVETIIDSLVVRFLLEEGATGLPGLET